MKRLLFSIVGMFVLSHAVYGIDMYTPMDYGTLASETLLFDPLDGTGTATLAGGANWTTGGGGMYGEGVNINQNFNERAYWDTNGISTSQLSEGTIEFYWKVPTGGVSWYGTLNNTFVEDSATYLDIHMPNNNPAISFNLYQGGYQTLNSTNTTWTPDTWYHLAFTWSGSGMQIWIDGALDAFNGIAVPWGIQNSTTVSLGSPSGSRVPAEGIFDSLRISNTAYRYTTIPPVPQTCGDPGTEYLDTDLDQNCIVDLADLGSFVFEWLHCSDPNNVLCDSFWP